MTLEVLNLSRVANSVGSVALAQRAIADAYSFAERRTAFGKPIIDIHYSCGSLRIGCRIARGSRLHTARREGRGTK